MGQIDGAAEAGKRQILVVDDDPALRDLLSDMLSDDGYAPVATGRGAEATRLARRLQPALILLDARLPDLDGAEVVRQLREDVETAAIPVLMYTAYPRDSAEWREAAALGVPLLPKPFDLNDLLERVRALLDAP
jgi:DNA-binding response OmpR family regulator